MTRATPLAIVALTAAGSASAADFYVDSAYDVGKSSASAACDCVSHTGDCTLRAAIETANACAGADIVHLVDPGPYELTDASAGDLDIVEAVQVRGTGQIIDGMGNDRIFDIAYPGGTGGTLIRSVTLQNGSVAAGERGHPERGGCLRAVGTALTYRVEYTHFLGCKAVDGGGAIYSEADDATLLATSIVEAYSAGNGGGAWFEVGSAVLLRFVDAARNTSEAWGGGAYVNVDEGNGWPDVDIENSTFEANEAGAAFGGGGGVFLLSTHSGADLLVRATEFIGNVTLGSGGGLFVQAATELEVSDTTFDSNHAAAGGGICAAGDIDMRRSSLSFNRADVNGGGLHTTERATVANTTFGENLAGGTGGGVYGLGSQLVGTNLTFADNAAAGTGGAGAAAFSGTSSFAQFTNSVFGAHTSAGGSDCVGTFSVDSNMATDGSCISTSVTTDRLGDPVLEPGAWLTNASNIPAWGYHLDPASDAADSGNDAACHSPSPIGGIDQLGKPRDNPGCDRGALESVYGAE